MSDSRRMGEIRGKGVYTDVNRDGFNSYGQQRRMLIILMARQVLLVALIGISDV